MTCDPSPSPDGPEPGRRLPAMTRVDRLLFLCFFVSGASALVYEVVWLRWLVHLFGATTLAISTILTAYMSGLALGSWLAGRWAAAVARPLRAYGLLELAIGAYALALPLLLGGVVPGLRLVGATEASSYVALSLGRFVFAILLLAIPTACMGATLPILARFATPRLQQLGGRVGRLYAVNTAGAVLGTAVAGLVLLPTLGTTLTNQVAVALNVAVGVAAIVAGRRLVEPPAAGAGSLEGPAELAGPVDPGARRAAAAAFATIALSGALAMVYEVAWTRALALVLGSSVYAFTIMLVTFLGGLAGGSYLLARRVDRLVEPGLALGAVQLGIGVSALAGVWLLPELPHLFLWLFGWSGGRHDLLLVLQLLLSAALILVPALGSGAVFPICVRLTAPVVGLASRSVGNLYAVNTVGAIIGSFAGGFVLLPAAGIRGTLLVAVLLDLACAAALFVVLPARPRLALVAVAALLAVAVPVVTPSWPALTMVSGVAVYAERYHRLSREEFRQRRERARLAFYEEGLTTTVSVEESRGDFYLRVNGKTDASSGIDMPTQVLAGHLPLLFHVAPQDVLVIGLGSGVSVGATLRHPLGRVTVVELERAVVTASRLFEHVNGRPLADPRTRLVINDARNFLLLTSDRFDVIVSEPSNPWVTGAASLFTRDFFELARARLRPGGVYGQWLQLYSLTPETLRTVIATFQTVFPHVVVFQTINQDTFLVGSADPFRVDFAALERRLQTDAVRADLERVGLHEPADLFAWLLLDIEDVPRFARGAELNTDDNARLEFTAPRSLYVNAVAENLQRLTAAFAGGGTVLTGLTRTAPDGFAARLATRHLERDRPDQAAAFASAALRQGPRADLLVVAGRAAATLGQDALAEQHARAALALEPDHVAALGDLAMRLEARGRVAEARALLHRAEARGDVDAKVQAAMLDYRQGAYREAAAQLAGLATDHPGAALAAGLTQLALGDAARAETLLRSSLARRDDTRGRTALAAALDRLGRPAEARLERWAAIQLDEGEAQRLQRQARLRAAIGHLRWAEHDLRRARDLMPWSLPLHEERARLLEHMGERREAIAAWEETGRAFPGHARAWLEIAALWEAERDAARAREALRRYIAAEPNRELQRRAEANLRALSAPATTR
jgi:spermidine synthase